MRRWLLVAVGLLVAPWPPFAAVPALHAQSVPIQHESGQTVVPFYEGWYRDTDGTIRVSFGYLNLNYKETVEIPVGPNNKVEPGGPDHSQPTTFEPRRQVGVFTIALPKDSKAEFVWTLNYRGTTTSIPATLDPLYEIYALKKGGTRPAAGGLPVDNGPPAVRFTATGTPGVGPAGTRASLKTQVSTPLTLDLFITDDGLPTRGESPVGLSVTWSKYRGADGVVFAASSPKTQPANAGHKATTSVTFKQPGEYVLRALVSDGSGFNEQCCWTNAYATVTVSAGSGQSR